MELRYKITLQNYVMKLLRETKNNRNYVTLWRIRNQEVKIGVYIVENTLDGCLGSFIQLKLRVIMLHFVSENGS